MQKTLARKIFYTTLFLTIIIMPLSIALGESAIGGNLSDVSGSATCSNLKNIGDLITCYLATILRFLMWAAGFLSVVMIIVSGFMFMTAAGDTKKIGTAKSALSAAIVGMIIVALSFAIVDFVGSTLVGSWETTEEEESNTATDIYKQLFNEASSDSTGDTD